MLQCSVWFGMSSRLPAHKDVCTCIVCMIEAACGIRIGIVKLRYQAPKREFARSNLRWIPKQVGVVTI